MLRWFRTNSQLRRDLEAEKAKSERLAERVETLQLQSWIRRKRPDPHIVYRCPQSLPSDATEQIRRTS